MRTAPLLFAAAVMGLLFSTQSPAQAADIYVPDHHPMIQDAIDAAVDGDRVLVRAGIWKTNIDFKGKAITVKSVAGPSMTALDGQQVWHVVAFTSGEGSDSVLEGFTITNGKTIYKGGGIFFDGASPTITGNIIEGNSAEIGAGMRLYNRSSPLVINNTIRSNTADRDAGGMYIGYGCNPLIMENKITGNEAENGGGIECQFSTDCRIVGNVIAGNLASHKYGRGGAILCDEATPLIASNLIVDNTAEDYGGGIYFEYDSQVAVTNNTFVNNHAGIGGGALCLYNNKDTYFVNVTNSILWDNGASQGPEIYVGGKNYDSKLQIGQCDIEGGAASVYVESGSTYRSGAGMIDADPLFVDASLDDFHLTWSSPCRETGDPGAPGLPVNDFEGDPRNAGAAPDMGADEFHLHVYHRGDLVPGGTFDCCVVGTPGATPVWVALGAGCRENPAFTQYGQLWLEWPIRRVLFPDIPAKGVLVENRAVPTWWTPGTKHYMQAAAASELTNLDVLLVE